MPTALEHLTRDIRFAVRQLRTNFGFASTAVVTLAMGMAATIAIFAFVDAALIRPLPYHDSPRLVGVFESTEAFPQANLSFADYLDWKKLNSVFTSLTAYQGTGAALAGTDGVERVPVARVSEVMRDMLGNLPVGDLSVEDPPLDEVMRELFAQKVAP